jgi:hypothetical protein
MYTYREPTMLPDVPREELSEILDQVAAETLALAQIKEPPVDCLRLAVTLGIQLAWDDRQSGRARFVRLNTLATDSADSILLKPDPRPERRHWAVAHEVGEQQAHRVFAMLGVDPRMAPPAAREAVANYLANRILLPTPWFNQRAIASDWDLMALKQSFSTASHELLARRMLDFDGSVIISIWDQGKPGFRRSNLAGRLPGASAAERACQATVHTSGQPDFQQHTGWRIQGWPIHESDWKREILRVELDEIMLTSTIQADAPDW